MHFRYCFIVTLIFAAPLRAEDLGLVRNEFQQAYAAAQAGVTQEKPDSEALRTYSIYPYLQQMRLRRALANAMSDLRTVDLDIEALLRERQTEPATRELRRLWYASLAERKQWERLLENYRDVNDATLRCHTFTARLALQRLDGLQAAALDAWSKANASLPACEPAFTWLKAQQFLTPAHIERRARLALSAGNEDFARQLIVDLPAEVAAPLTVWVHFIEQPNRFITAASKTAVPTKVIEPTALLDGWTRLARSDQNAAMNLYKPLVQAQQLPKTTASRFALELALALAWNRHAEALRYFALVDADDFDERAYEWHARATLWAEDWQRCKKVIAAMPDGLRKQTRWRYWSARATEQLGDQRAAREQYTDLQGDDNYYAALAAARLQQSYKPTQQALSIDANALSQIERQPAFVRTRELLATGLHNEAYDEWREGYNKLQVDARVQSIALAAQWGWHEQAILTAAQLGLFDDYGLLFPRPFDNEVIAAAKVTELSPALIYATMRQESLFRTDALSTAGARGLMQLVPDTARQTARRWGLAAPTDLFQPMINIPIGAAHLRDLHNSFGGNSALALAAYNAGPGNARRWLPTQPKAADVWIENIPFNETRIYVQRILWYSVVFGWLATNNSQDTSAWLKMVTKPS